MIPDPPNNDESSNPARPAWWVHAALEDIHAPPTANAGEPTEAAASGEQPSFDVENDAPPPVIPVPEVKCWRCGKMTQQAPHCAHCGAAFAVEPSIQTPTPETSDPVRAVLRLLASYSVLLAMAAAFGIAAYIANSDGGSKPRRHSLFEHSIGEAIIETLWTIAVLAAIRTVPRPPPLAVSTQRRRLLGWTLALPVLAICLLANVMYHHVLHAFIGPGFDEAATPHVTPTAEAVALAILFVCIQPGIIEELYFRYLALGTLRRVMGVGGALVISSIMFGIAHVHSPLSIPVLMVVGLGLGAVRLWSRSLLLPMLMHALHNGFVLWMEYSK